MDLERWRESKHLSLDHLFPWHEWLLGFHGGSAGFEGWGKATGWEGVGRTGLSVGTTRDEVGEADGVLIQSQALDVGMGLEGIEGEVKHCS